MRRENDQYFTLSGLTRSLLEHVPEIAHKKVLEPCAGMGHISSILLSDYYCRVSTNDIDPAMPTNQHFCATDDKMYYTFFDAYGYNPYDWAVTNPPYNSAGEILGKLVEMGFAKIAMLLRLSFMEPTKSRRDVLGELAPHLSHLIIFSPRPSFTENGRSDSVTSAWFVWQRSHSGGTRVINCTDWKTRND